MLHRKIGGTPATSRDVQRASEPSVGKRTLVEQSSVTAAEIAGGGMTGAGGPLPHLDKIQQSFGHHDVSGVTAHQGADARAASSALGASAYAYSGAVAFGATPDLHTAAHEAAHVVQQRGGVQLKGGIDQPGDSHERHADAVADAVVAGESAAPLLDQVATPGAGHGSRSTVVQRTGPDNAAAPSTGDHPAATGAPATAVVTPPSPGINQMGFIDHDEGSNIRTGPAEAGGQMVRNEPLPPATRVYVSGTHPNKPEWYYVTAYLTDTMVRGYVQNFRVNTRLPEPLAELYPIVQGDTAEALAQRKFGRSVTDGHDLRFYENVMLYVNQQQGRAGVTGTYQSPNVLGGGSNNVQLEAGHRIWLVSAAYAMALSNVVPSGSLTSGAVASVRRFAGHLQDILAAVNESPSHVGEVAADYAQAIMEHRVEIASAVAVFLTAEMASAFLAATPTGVTQIAAAVIQLLLAFFGAQGLVMASLEAANHAANWLRIGWEANGNPEQIAAASREFVRMIVAIAVAALAYLGMRGNVRNAVTIMNSLPPSGMAPALAIAGGGSRSGAGAIVGEGVAIGPTTGAPGVGGNAMLMNGNEERPTGGAGGRPEGWDKFDRAHDAEFRAELDEFGGNPTPDRSLRGGEGQLFLGRDPLLALKRWFQSRVGDMAESLRRLRDTKALIDANPRLAENIDVVRLGRQGSDWVVREFDPTSVELKVAGDGAPQLARTRAIAELERLSGQGSLSGDLAELLRKLRRNPPSANLHWSPAKGKILVIDMQ